MNNFINQKTSKQNNYSKNKIDLYKLDSNRFQSLVERRIREAAEFMFLALFIDLDPCLSSMTVYLFEGTEDIVPDELKKIPFDKLLKIISCNTLDINKLASLCGYKNYEEIIKQQNISAECFKYISYLLNAFGIVWWKLADRIEKEKRNESSTTSFWSFAEPLMIDGKYKIGDAYRKKIELVKNGKSIEEITEMFLAKYDDTVLFFQSVVEGVPVEDVFS